MSTAAYTREYRARDPEGYAARIRVDTARRSARPTTTHLARYGLTIEQYAEMLASQDGLCAICRQPETRLYRGKTLMCLSVDHIEIDGRLVVRGLLCHACNLALGFLRDDPHLALAAGAYLASAPK